MGAGGTTAEASECKQPAAAWLETLQSALYPEFRANSITSSGYVEADTSGGKAYYVAVTVEGVPGVAVFGTSEPPLQADPGLIAAANPAASQLSDLGADIPEDSPAGAQLLDDDATSAAESCTTTPGSGTAAAQTPSDQVKDAAIAQGYGDLEIFSSGDDLIDHTGLSLCRGARPLAPKLGDRLAPSLGKGFAKGYNEQLGPNLTSDDGTAIVEIFLTAYCPEIL